LGKYLSILRINWIHALEYRANALIGLFAILSGLFIEYQIWSLIFSSSDTSSIAMQGSSSGYTFEQLIIFIFLSIIVGQLKSSWITSTSFTSSSSFTSIGESIISFVAFIGLTTTVPV